MLDEVIVSYNGGRIICGSLRSLRRATIMSQTCFSTGVIRSADRSFGCVLFISSTVMFVTLLLSCNHVRLALLAFLPVYID